jgi:hypothetical protein
MAAFISNSQYILITCKRDLVLYRALLIVYNTFRAQPEDGCIRGAETCCCLFVCFPGRPRQATDVLQPTGLLYRPLWTFQPWLPDVPAPTDAFRTLAAEVETYGRE